LCGTTARICCSFVLFGLVGHVTFSKPTRIVPFNTPIVMLLALAEQFPSQRHSQHLFAGFI
jgi:hypothetical protein